MRKDDRGVPPHGATLLDDSAGAASGGPVRQQPAAPGKAENIPQPAVPADAAKAEARSARTSPQPPSVPAEAAKPSDAGTGLSPEPRAPGSPAQPGHGTATRTPAAGSQTGEDAGRRDTDTPAPVAVRTSGVVVRPVTDTPEPSLARVLATTIGLWVSRRLRKIGIGRRRPPYPGAAASYREPTTGTRPRTVWRWRLAAILLAVAILALVALQLSGVLNKPGPAGGTAASSGSRGTPSLSAAAAARNQAANWVAQQVGSGNIIACDPVVCSALLGRGIPAGRLLPLQSAGANPFGADVIVASPSVRSEYGSELTNVYAPALIGSFGSGATRVDVRAIAPQGGAAYRTAEQPDMNARQAAGAQLLHNPRFHPTAQAASQITAGQVDARLLVTLASLVSQRAVSVASFSDTGPGAPVQFRQVTITSPGGQDSVLTADLDQVRTQRTPYLPESATIVHPGGPTVLRIEFGAPSPQGLLTGGNSSLETALGGERVDRDERLSSGRAFYRK
jgi:hypothetical protein